MIQERIYCSKTGGGRDRWGERQVGRETGRDNDGRTEGPVDDGLCFQSKVVTLY